MKLMSEHQATKASIELRNAVRLKRDFINAWKALAEADEASKDWSRVSSDLRTIVELAPDDIAATLKLGKLLLLAGSTNEALTIVNAGLGRDAHNANLHALKAAITLKLDDRVGAVREAQTVLGLDPSNAHALMVLAIERLNGGDAKAALSLLAPLTGEKTLENNAEFQLLRVRLLRQIGDLNSAEVTLKKLVEENPSELGYRKLLVNLYIEQHRYDDAEGELRSLVATNPSDPVVMLDLIQFLLNTKRAPVEARQELNDRIEMGGDIFSFQIALANLDFSEGKWDAGQYLLDKLISNAATSEREQMARIVLARMFLSRRMYDQAEKLANDVLHDSSRNVPALMIRAAVHLERSQPDAAVPDLVSALGYQPRSMELMSLLATAYERSGLIALADKQFADATTVSGFDPHVGLEYADFLARRGSPARAEEVLVGLMKRQPNNSQVLSALAQLRLVRQDWSGAQEVAQFLRRVGDVGRADQVLGAALIGQRKYDDAITLLQRAYQTSPFGAQSINSLISVYLKANKREQASIFLKSVIAKNPKDSNALVQLGALQLAKGEKVKATETFLAAIKAQPEDPTGYYALGRLYQRQKKYDEAIGILRKGLQEQPDALTLKISLAGASEEKGDYEAAILEYESILDKQPGNLIASNNLVNLLLDHRTDVSSLKKAQSLAAILHNSQVPQFKDTLGWAKFHQAITPAPFCFAKKHPPFCPISL